MQVPGTSAEAEPAGLQQALRRLLQLNEISKLLTRFESIETTASAVLAQLGQTLALRSAILMVEAAGGAEPRVWQAGGSTAERLRAAVEHASSAHAYLVGRRDLPDPGETSTSGESGRAPGERGEGRQGGGNFIVLPLVVADRPIFGTLQLEGTDPLAELDLVFANAVVNQLAIALDRIVAIDARQADAEMRRFAAEQGEAFAKARETEAKTSLKEQGKKLQSSEQLVAIGRLAAGVAHEINNPLGVILGYVTVLRKKAGEGFRAELEIIEDEAIRCKEIVEGLLDLASPLRGEPQPVELAALAAEAAGWLGDTFHSIATVISVQGSGVAAGNPKKLWQVITNLLRNAVEAAGSGGSVSVTIGPSGEDFVELAVQDSGPGLPAGQEEKLFEPFFSTKETGTGLGLAVSRGIVLAHGGSIEAGPSPSGGASFVVRLPVWRDLPAG